MQAAEQAIHVGETARDSAGLAAAFIGQLRHEGGVLERLDEGLEASIRDAGGGKVEQLLLGDLDLLLSIDVDVMIMSIIHDIRADRHELAADIGVVYDPPIVMGVDDGDDGGCELCQIGRAIDALAANFGQRALMFEIGLEGDRIGDLRLLDQFRDRVIDSAMDRIGEMHR